MREHMNCIGCANRRTKGDCLVMQHIPKPIRWCYKTTDQAIKTEEDIIRYIENRKTPEQGNRDLQQLAISKRKLRKLKGETNENRSIQRLDN